MANFLDSKDEKITEKQFTRSLITSVLSILVCIVALCSASYAWFTESTSSNSHTLMSGSFDLDVSVTKAAGEIATAATVAIIKDEGAMRCTLQKGGTYTIVLSMTPDSTVKGYCSVVMNGTRQEITAPISQDPAIGVSPLIFTVTTGEEDVTVVFCAKWGYPAAPTIQHGDVIAFGADEVSDAV